VVEKYTNDYDEQSNFIKLKFGNGEIDFIVAPNLTDRNPIRLNVEGRT